MLPQGPSRFDVLTLQALANGLMDASILQVYETRFRPEERRDQDWLAYQADKVRRGLATLEAAPPATLADGEVPDAGQIALACALGYLDLRFEGAWRTQHPRLVAWLAAFEAAVPAYGKTRFNP